MGSTYKDLDGNNITNSISVAPYSSIILTKGNVTNISIVDKTKLIKSNLYPNPVYQSEKINIESEYIVEGQILDLLIYNTIGETIINKQIKPITDGKIEIELRTLPKSDYIIQIQTNHKNQSYRLQIK